VRTERGSVANHRALTDGAEKGFYPGVRYPFTGRG
jgi:hypothetical protein